MYQVPPSIPAHCWNYKSVDLSNSPHIQRKQPTHSCRIQEIVTQTETAPGNMENHMDFVSKKRQRPRYNPLDIALNQKVSSHNAVTALRVRTGCTHLL